MHHLDTSSPAHLLTFSPPRLVNCSPPHLLACSPPRLVNWSPPCLLICLPGRHLACSYQWKGDGACDDTQGVIGMVVTAVHQPVDMDMSQRNTATRSVSNDGVVVVVVVSSVRVCIFSAWLIADAILRLQCACLDPYGTTSGLNCDFPPTAQPHSFSAYIPHPSAMLTWSVPGHMWVTHGVCMCRCERHRRLLLQRHHRLQHHRRRLRYAVRV